MNARERYLKIMNYEKVDRIPVMAVEPYEDTTLAMWYREGYSTSSSPEDSLGMDRFTKIPADFSIFPRPEYKVIYENETEIVSTDFMYGATVRKMKRNPSMFYGYIDHPVKCMDDWMRMKDKFNVDMEMKKPVNMECILEHLNDSSNPVSLTLFPYFFRLGFYMMGMENFMTAFYDMPDLIHDMFSFYNDFVIKTIAPYIAGAKVDCAVFAEDFAYNKSPHVSPAIYEEFWLPYQNLLVKELKKNKVPVICAWSAGNFDAYIPKLLGNGINCIWPVERCSPEMDPIELRKKYGRDLLMSGGISKRCLIDGPDAIDREIERLMPVIQEGGFIPALDDMVSPDISLSNYRYYIRKLYNLR